MKKFILRLLIFFSPIIIIVGFLEYRLYKTGDLISIENVIERQIKDPSLLYLRRDFSSNPNTYKVSMIRKKKPTILAIGSSRVMQFRKECFAPFSNNFYNAGGSVQRINDIIEFIRQFKKGELPKPEILIIGIDPWLLKTTQVNDSSWIKSKALKDDIYIASTHWENYKKIVKSRKLPKPVSGKLGLGATGRTGIGYRIDGSMNYGSEIIGYYNKEKKFFDRENPPVIERIIKRTHQFSLPAIVDSQRVSNLISSIDEAQKNGISVIVYLAPFSSESYDSLLSADGLNEWMNYYRNDFSNQLQDVGVSVINTGKPSDFGLSDLYMIDGFHPTESLVCHQWIKFLEKSEVSKFKKFNLDEIKSLLSNINSNPVSLGIN